MVEEGQPGHLGPSIGILVHQLLLNALTQPFEPDDVGVRNGAGLVEQPADQSRAIDEEVVGIFEFGDGVFDDVGSLQAELLCYFLGVEQPCFVVVHP